MSSLKERYLVKSKISQGGMARIILAIDSHKNRPVVIKTIKPDLFQGKSASEADELCKSLLKEGEILKGLDHENIVKFHQFQLIDKRPAIILEFVNGMSLGEIIDGKYRFRIEAKLSIISQVCMGIDYVNRKNIVHADLKPKNIVISSDWIAKVVDFGLSHRMDEVGPKKVDFLTGGYCAPEQLDRKVSAATDVFSAGVLAFEFLTGVHPFMTDTADDTLKRIRMGCFRVPQSLNHLPVEPIKWGDVFKRVFSPEPQKRYRSPLHFYDDLLDSFSVRGKKNWIREKHFRYPDMRFAVSDENEPIRHLKWERFKQGLKDTL